MDPVELSETVEDIIHDARSRVGPGSIGERQYDVEPDVQHFEVTDLKYLFTYAEEELLDLINYAVMMVIRIRRLAQRLEDEDSANNPDRSA